MFRLHRIVPFTGLSASLIIAFTIYAIQPGLRPTVFAVTDARVIVEPGKELSKATVVIRDGIIEAVGEQVTPPADALVIDGEGLSVYPGFIDGGSSWGIDTKLKRSEGGAPASVDYSAEALATTKPDNRKGVTPEFSVGSALTADESMEDSWRKQGFAVRLAAPSGGIFSGQSALVSLNGLPPRESIIRDGVAQHAAFKISGSGYPRTLMGIIAHARQSLLDASRHSRRATAFYDQGIGRRPPRDPALDALNDVLEKKHPVIFEANTKDEIHRALDFCEEFGIQPILYGATKAWKAADRIKAANVPVILRLDYPEKPVSRRSAFLQRLAARNPAMAKAAQEQGKAKDTTPARVKKDRERRLQEDVRNAAILEEEGITFAFSSDGLQKPDQFKKNLSRVIAAGLSPEAALRAFTLNAAEILGADRYMGVVAPGKAAHLTVMTGDFNDKDSKVRYIFSDGVRFEYEAPKKSEKKKSAEKKPSEKKAAQGGAEAKKEDKNEGNDEDEKNPEPLTELDTDRKPGLNTKGSVFIKGGTVLTVTNGTIKGDILIRNGIIAKVGENLAVPEGMPMIDAHGMYIMPGIIDTHCHFAMTGGVNEATLSIVPEVRVRDIIDSEDVQIFRGLAGGVTTCRLLHGSANVIGGQDAVIKLKYGESASELLLKEAPRGVKFALGENVKRTGGRFPDTRLGVEAVLVRAFTEAQEYKNTWAAYEESKSQGKRLPEPRRDLRLEALADILDGKLHIHCHCYRADEILMLLRVADRFGFKIKSLQHVLEGYKIAAEIAAHGASCSSFADWWAYKIEAYDAIPFNAALLHEAGALVTLKSDSNELMRHMPQEAAKMMKYGGMSETEALKLITLNGATQLGLSDRIGSIEVGKDADLAIFNAHPLNSYARCEWTLVEGEVYFQRTNGDPAQRGDDELTEIGKSLVAAKNGPSGTAEAVTAGFDRGLPCGERKLGEMPVLNVDRNSEDKYAIVNATIHPVSGPPIEEGKILIDKGRIAGVGKDFTIPPGYTVVDAGGLHVYPGMIDAGTVLGLTELGSAQETQDYAEGGDFHPDLRAAIGIHPDSELIPVTRANGVLTVVSRPMRAIVAGQSALVNLRGWVPKEMVMIEELALHVDFPVTTPIFTGTPTLPALGRMLVRKQRDEKIRRAKVLFQQAVAYDKARTAAGSGQQSVPRDARLEALVPYARGDKPVIILANRENDILEAIKLAEELNLKMILMGGIDSWKVADKLKEKDIPVILGPVMILPQEQYDPFDGPFACAAKLHAAGVRFCIHSAGGENPRNLPYEAAMSVTYGLPREEGLKSVTLYPAQILGVSDHLGSIEEGKLANLVVADGDMLQATTQIRGLFIKGVPTPPTSKHTRLYKRYQQRLREVKSGRAPLGTGS